MKNNRLTVKKDLLERLVQATEARIAQHGLRGIRARDVTRDAGCALGALYTVAEGLDDLVIRVNSRTLARLGGILRAAVPQDASAAQIMQALARAYVRFAQQETALWSAVFNHRLPQGVTIPDWHAAEHAVLIEQIIAPLSKLRPDLGPEPLRLRAQTLFASVHGVVQLSVQGGYVGTPPALLADEVAALVRAMTGGITESESTTG